MEKNRFFTAETIKAITIAVLVPIAISVISYAQEQRGINDNLQSIKESLVHLQKNQVIENNKISTLYRQNTKLFQSQSSNSEKLNALSSSIKHQGKDIVNLSNSISSIKTSIADIKQNTIPGGNERIQRLENKIYN